MIADVASSYALCQQVARRTARNFYYTFYLVPRDKRLAMCALYAFLRHTDDLADNPRPLETRREALRRWRTELDQALADAPRHPVLPALCDTVVRYNIPPRYLYDVLDGVEMDLGGRRYATFQELHEYCYRVASVVGLSCIHIWGYRGPQAHEPASQCGLALQMTNILRDVKEDVEQGRVYLPLDDLERFGCTIDDLRGHVPGARLRALIQFEIARAEELYAAGSALEEWLEPAGRPIFRAITGTYRALLDEIKRRDGDVFSRRVHLPAWRKLHIASRSWWTPPSVFQTSGSSKS